MKYKERLSIIYYVSMSNDTNRTHTHIISLRKAKLSWPIQNMKRKGKEMGNEYRRCSIKNKWEYACVIILTVSFYS